MKKFLFFSATVALIIGLIYAAPSVNSTSRYNQKGNLSTMDGIGVKYSSIKPRTVELSAVAGAGMLYGVVLSSRPANIGYVTIVDSSTACAGNGDTIMNIYPGAAGSTHTFSPPIRFNFGICAVVNTTSSVSEEDSIYYLLDSEK